MAIRKTKAGTFEVDFRDQYGKKRLKTFAKNREAVAYEKEVLAQVAKREYVAPSNKTLREVAEEWYRNKAAQAYRRSTLRSWNNHIDHFIVRSLGDFRVHDLDVQSVEDTAAKWSLKTSPKTANKILTTLTAVIDMAERRELVKRNVAEKAERMKVATEEDNAIEVEPDQVYSEVELGKLIQATEGRDRLFVMIMGLTGLRIGEVLALTWPAVDLKAGLLHVRLTLADSDKGAEPLFQPPKTKMSRRTIELPRELIRELKVWKLRCPTSERDLVFATEEGKPFHRKAVSKILDGAIEKAEVKRLTPHGLRHTFASLLLAKRKPVPEVSRLLGHKDSYTTMKIYAHFTGEQSTATQELASSVMAEG
jgi:integrase